MNTLLIEYWLQRFRNPHTSAIDNWNALDYQLRECMRGDANTDDYTALDFFTQRFNEMNEETITRQRQNEEWRNRD